MLQSWALGRAAASSVMNELWLLLLGFASTFAARWVWFFPPESDDAALHLWARSAFPELPFPLVCEPKALLQAGALSCPCLRTGDHLFFTEGTLPLLSLLLFFVFKKVFPPPPNEAEVTFNLPFLLV